METFTYAGETQAYVYDNDGLLTGAERFTIGRNTANGLLESIFDANMTLSSIFNGYGEAGRLAAVYKDGVLIEGYQYNSNGSRIYEMNTLRGIDGRDLNYSAEDCLLTACDTVYEYNPDGYLTTKTFGTDVTTYDYSSRGELLSVSLPDGTIIEYLHDPLGRRAAKMINGAIIEKYLWSGLTTLLAVSDGDNNLLMRFEYADDRMPYAMTAGGVANYLVYDQVGSLITVADGAGNVVKKIEYDAFGSIITDTDPLFYIPFGFAGGMHDRDTGLVRFGYRDYDPDTGRWTAKDPIFFDGGDTDLYGYVLSDPVNWIDPYGLFVDSTGAYTGAATIAAEAAGTSVLAARRCYCGCRCVLWNANGS